jgi:hypothetical protein
MRGMDIRDAPLPGAITVNHPSARVTLENVEIYNASGYGIYQRRGDISLEDVTISNVQGIRGDYLSGAGAVFENGVAISAADVSIINCDGSAMRISGSDTRLHARELTIERCFINILEGAMEADFIINEETMEEGILYNSGAALEIFNFAHAHISNLRMEDNGYQGVLVTNNSRLNLTRSNIRNCTQFDPPDISSGRSGYGGFGIRVRKHSFTDINNFSIRDNDLAGVFVGLNVEVYLHNGWIVGNAIGARVIHPGYDTDRLRDNVRWDNESADIDTDEIYVPGTENPLED